MPRRLSPGRPVLGLALHHHLVVVVFLLLLSCLGAVSGKESEAATTNQKQDKEDNGRETPAPPHRWTATVYEEADGALSVKEGVLDGKQGVATAIFDTQGRGVSGWAELVLSRGEGWKNSTRREATAFGLLEGYLTCADIGAFRTNAMLGLFPPTSITTTTNGGDGGSTTISDPVPTKVMDFLRANDIYMRTMVAKHEKEEQQPPPPHDDHDHQPDEDNDDTKRRRSYWAAVGDALAQLDGLVEGYRRSHCYADYPLGPHDFLALQAYGDMFDLIPALLSVVRSRQQPPLQWRRRPHTGSNATSAEARKLELLQKAVGRGKAVATARLRAADASTGSSSTADEDTTTTSAEKDSLRSSSSSSQSSPPPRRRRRLVAHRCTGVVKLTAHDVLVGHSTWDVYALLWPRVFKTLHYGPSGQSSSFSSSPGLLASLDDFYLLRGGKGGGADLALVESSYEMLEPVKYGPLITPTSVLCWVRIMVANRLARSGREWGEIFGRENSGTYNTNWLVVDMGHVSTGGQQLSVEDGLLTLVEGMPGAGMVVVEDLTWMLRDKGYVGVYNIPYTKTIRDKYGYNLHALRERVTGEYDYHGSPRAKQLEANHGRVHGLPGMRWLMGYNDPNDPHMDGHPLQSIAGRGDLEDPRDISNYWEGGSLDGKVASYRSAFHDQDEAPLIMARVGPTTDQQPAFCWGQPGNRALRRMAHVGHPECFRFHWAQVGGADGWPTAASNTKQQQQQQQGGDDDGGHRRVELPAFWR